MTTTGAQRRDAGVQQVLDAEGRSKFVEYAEAALTVLIRRGEPFSSNDVHRLLTDTPASVPHHPNVIPALFSRASKSGRIRRIGNDTATAERSHARTVGMWISTVVDESPVQKMTPYETETRLDELQEMVDVFQDFMLRLKNRLVDVEDKMSTEAVKNTNTSKGAKLVIEIVREEIDRKVNL